MLCAIFLALPGCASGKAPVNASASQAPAVQGESSAAAPVADAKPFVTLRFAFPAGNGGEQRDQALVQAAISAYTKERLNADVILNPLDWSVAGERIPLMVQSGEDVDIVFMPDWMGYYGYAKSGAILPLDDLLAEYGQGILSTLPESLIEGPKYNGVLYGIACNKDISFTGGLFLTKALVDKHGFDVNSIKQVNQLEPWLKTIQDNEPGITPMFFGTGNLDWLGLPTEESKDEGYVFDKGAGVGFNNVTEKFVPYYETVFAQSYFKLIYDWKQKGYINEDAGLNQTDNAAEIKAGRAWTLHSSSQPGQIETWSILAGQPMTLVKGRPAYVTNSATCGALVALTNANKDPARSIEFLNLLYTDPYIENLCLWGIEGTNYIKEADGRISLPPGAETWNDNGYNPGTSWEYGNQLTSYVTTESEADQWEKLEQFNKTEMVPAADLGWSFDGTAVQDELDACNAINSEYSSILKNGMDDAEQTLATINKRLHDAGLDKILAEMQKQYDEWLAVK
jgi:putative aldouronate transport system substrate-binding protein